MVASESNPITFETVKSTIDGYYRPLVGKPVHVVGFSSWANLTGSLVKYDIQSGTAIVRITSKNGSKDWNTSLLNVRSGSYPLAK